MLLQTAGLQGSCYYKQQKGVPEFHFSAYFVFKKWSLPPVPQLLNSLTGLPRIYAVEATASSIFFLISYSE
jgi:hypothetical protein